MFKRSLIAGAVLSVSLGAHAVGANISVTGTVTPDACTIALGNNGNVDYGTLTAWLCCINCLGDARRLTA